MRVRESSHISEQSFLLALLVPRQKSLHLAGDVLLLSFAGKAQARVTQSGLRTSVRRRAL